MSAALVDLGARVTGVVIDQALWDLESRVRRVRPMQAATGVVVTVWPGAPRVVGIHRPSGDYAVVTIGGPR